jgi:TPP-dependent pyruvate/acetoin dehydrogenase alpha subunit
MAMPVEARKSTVKTAALKKAPTASVARVSAPKTPRAPRGKKAPPPNLFAKALDIAHEDAIELLRRIMRVRCADRANIYRGCEAALAGVGSGLGADDVVLSTLGPVGTATNAISVSRGIEPAASAGANGNAAAVAPNNALGGTRNFTGGVALAPGIALACRLQRKRQIAVVIMDGAITRSGPFFEALQLAVEWELPLLLVCLHEPPDPKSASHGRTWTSRAESFGLAGARCDGLQVLDVREAAKLAVSHVRNHKGPYLLELTIPAAARSGAVDDDGVAKADPLAIFRARLIEAEALNTEQADRLQLDLEQHAIDGRRA